MSEKRRGLGKGLGALIPTTPTQGRPVDVFFPEHQSTEGRAEAATKPATRAGGTAAERAATEANTERTTNGTAARGRSTATADRASSGRGTATRAGGRKTAKPRQSVPPLPARAGKSAPTGEEPASAPTPEDDLVPVPGATFAELPVAQVVANRRQPRQVFDEDELDELAASIREVGVLQPIVVRPLSHGEEPTYELIMGERRWRASQLAGQDSVPAIIREVADDDLLRDALLENLHRAQLNPLEEAAAYQQLLDDFSCTHEELAARIARSRPQISNTLRLLKLPPSVQRRVAAGILSAGHARALLGLSDPAAMERLAQRIVAEGLSVRSTEEIIALGDEPTAPEMRRRPRAGAHAAELDELASRLADRFDTRVKIGMGQRKGRINIEFASVEDLNRILGVLAPSLDGLQLDA
ncbi:MAG TPA: ParB/RepB/Spo0J family partition protein [Jiangellaceae bacterium]|nr:ParB/RepB/Spo0J family partition protein [Jiangellaceae bacterium]